MNVTLDGNGYARIDGTYNNSNFSDFTNQVRHILSLMEMLDRQQITDATNIVIERYAGTTENYNEFMRDWADILTKVNNGLTI
jgi:hypothetical protein